MYWLQEYNIGSDQHQLPLLTNEELNYLVMEHKILL